MQQNSPQLFIEISNLEIVFIVGKNNKNHEFELIYSNNIKVNDARENEIFDFDWIYNSVNENIYLIEQKINFTFKEVTLIIDMLNNFLINLGIDTKAWSYLVSKVLMSASLNSCSILISSCFFSSFNFSW